MTITAIHQDISQGLDLQYQEEDMPEVHDIDQKMLYMSEEEHDGLKQQDQVAIVSKEQDALRLQDQMETMSEDHKIEDQMNEEQNDQEIMSEEDLKLQDQWNEEQREIRWSQDKRLEVPNKLTSSDKKTHEVSLMSGPKRCLVPEGGGFKAWEKGKVTVLSPELPVDCLKVLAGDLEEIGRINRTLSTWKNALSDQEMLYKAHNCSWLRDHFHHNLYNSQLEESFPIAFTFVVYDSPQQVLRLLRLLYRPQNTYCIHVDVKSQHKEFFRAIAECFDNVVISSQLENVIWGYYTILQVEICKCLFSLHCIMLFSNASAVPFPPLLCCSPMPVQCPINAQQKSTVKPPNRDLPL